MNVDHCQRCNKSLISEEFSGHVCTPYLSGTKEITIDYSYEIIDSNGDKVIIAKGLDGLLYGLIECHHKPMHPTNLDTNKNQSKTRQNRQIAAR